MKTTDTVETPSWQAAVADVDPSELLAHPTVQAVLEAERAADRERQETERRRRLRDDDPLAYVAEEQQREREEAERNQLSGPLNTIARELNEVVSAVAREHLPKRVLDRLAQKRYPGTLAEGFRAYMVDVVSELKEAGEPEAARHSVPKSAPARRPPRRSRPDPKQRRRATAQSHRPSGTSTAAAAPGDSRTASGSMPAWPPGPSDRTAATRTAGTD